MLFRDSWWVGWTLKYMYDQNMGESGNLGRTQQKQIPIPLAHFPTQFNLNPSMDE